MSFETKSGELICHKQSDQSITMDFPQYRLEELVCSFSLFLLESSVSYLSYVWSSGCYRLRLRRWFWTWQKYRDKFLFQNVYFRTILWCQTCNFLFSRNCISQITNVDIAGSCWYSSRQLYSKKSRIKKATHRTQWHVHQVQLYTTSKHYYGFPNTIFCTIIKIMEGRRHIKLPRYILD